MIDQSEAGIYLAAGEHVVGLAGVELDLGDGGLVSGEEGGGVEGGAEVPHPQHAVHAPGHEDVRLRGVHSQAPHSAALIPGKGSDIVSNYNE